MQRTGSHLSYRADIDGLRAVAVLAVIAYHVFPKSIGGFIGVDIFFVISGFLISTILFTECEQGRFSLTEFYARRIRRIFPALVIVLVACWAFGWFALSDTEYRQLKKHLAGGSTFLSNFLLWRETGYFDQSAEAKPLLHLWSLGIEEQFYLLWPPMIYLSWKRKLNVGLLALLIVALSFWWNLGLSASSVVTAFYLPHTRLWELLLGGLVAYVECFRKDDARALLARLVFRSEKDYDASWLANAAAIAGLCLIAIPLLVLSRDAPAQAWWFNRPLLHDAAVAVGLDRPQAFPGWWAALPTLGTALLIAAGTTPWVNRRVLAQPSLVYLGLMSYPLYLWHWPLLSFVHITESTAPSATTRTAAVALAFVLAWATYRFVEQPVRRVVSSRTPMKLAFLTISLLSIAVLAAYAYRAKTSSRNPYVAEALDDYSLSPRHDPVCNAKFPTKGEYCEEYSPDLKATTALIGDSHAAHFLRGVGEYLRRKGEDVVHLGESGCPPLLGVEKIPTGGSELCTSPSDSVVTYVGGNSAITRVLMSFRAVIYMTEGVEFEAGQPVGQGQGPFSFKAAGTDLSPSASMRLALERTVDYFLQQHKTVWLILQVPELGFPAAECVGRPFSFERKIRYPCTVPASTVLRRQADFRQIVAEIQKKLPALHVFDPMASLCDASTCGAVGSEGILYADSNHLSRAGSLFFSDKFAF